MYPLGLQPEVEYVTRSNGLVYKVYDNLYQAKRDGKNYQDIKFNDFSNIPQANLEHNIYYRDLLSDIFFDQSSYLIETGQLKPAQQLFQLAGHYDVDVFSKNFQAYVRHRDKWLK